MRKRRGVARRTVDIGGYTFCFEEATEQEYWDTYKNGEPLAFIWYVTAERDGKIVARYERSWENVNNSHVQHFIDRFCEDAAFRAKWQTGGERIDAVREKQDTLIHPRCARAIARLNVRRPEQLRFQDFLQLKTYGRDRVSSMKLEDLKDLLPADRLAQLTEEIGGDRALQVLRWIRRGLDPDHAVHKVKVDMEVAQNARDSRASRAYIR